VFWYLCYLARAVHHGQLHIQQPVRLASVFSGG
jgi:hypothetical protein